MATPQLQEETFGMMGSAVETLEDVPPQAIRESQMLIRQIRDLSDCNYLYYKCLQLLQLSGLTAEIPRLVVFGQQSMGKTTLLDFIMGGPIGYSSTDTGTKQPVVIMLNPSTGNKMECVFKGERMSIKELQDAMADHMKLAGETISDVELKVEIFVPGGVYAVFVDLPGIKDDSKVGSEFTRAVVRNYVRHNPNDLYILVKKSSDDPANWPWSLREFILSSAPRGLGLTRRQTVVVGTRAKEFVTGERNDVRTQLELLNRVSKRAVADQTGEPFPLFLLELYSLDVELKTSGNFQEQKKVMYEQIRDGQVQVSELLHSGFELTALAKERQKLLNYFDTNLFKKELNLKFQNLLNEQLGILERRLAKRRTEIRSVLSELQEKATDFTPSACREYIKLFIRELIQIVTELLTGNYLVMRLPENGKGFLAELGGSLMDNLADGNQLAMELYPNPMHYDSRIYDEMSHMEMEKIRLEKEQEDRSHNPYQRGVIVRFKLPKNDVNMYGVIERPPQKLESKNGFGDVTVTFYVQSPTQPDEVEGRDKTVATDRITILKRIPLTNIPEGLTTIEVWVKALRTDGWIGFSPGLVEVDDIVEINGDSTKDIPVRLLEQEEEGDNPVTMADSADVFVDPSVFPDTEGNKEVEEPEVSQKAYSRYVNVKLLNQLALTSLSAWMQTKIATMEPEQRFSDQIMLQMMRSVHHVIDKADWQPLVADLLQANIRDGMLNLAKLVSCSSAVALRRTLKAACFEMRRHITDGTIKGGMSYLGDNHRFMAELEDAIEEYCRTKAIACIATMESAIFEQTYAIRFEIIEDIFNGCSKYEEEFLGTRNVRGVMKTMNDYLRQREHAISSIERKLNLDDKKSTDLIYTEVRMQFWVAKMLLSTPLATKVYIHFIRGVTDKSSHLASMKNVKMMCESELETFLQMKLLGDPSQSGDVSSMLASGNIDRYVQRQDLEIMEHFDLAQNLELIERRRAGMERADAYIRIAQEAIGKLRSQIHRQGGVDFLMRLNVEAGVEKDEGSQSTRSDTTIVSN